MRLQWDYKKRAWEHRVYVQTQSENYMITVNEPEYDEVIIKWLSRKEMEQRVRCIDREAGLDCGCLICGRD